MSDVILITGVGKRLGYELACHLLEKGYKVAGTYRTEYSALNALRQLGVDLYQVDFYQQQQVNSFIRQVVNEYKSVRAIIHNASDWLPDNKARGKAFDYSSSDYSDAEILHKMMTIHVSIPYQLNQAFQAQLKNAAYGASDIIHISDYVEEKGSKKHIAYAASKAALNNLTLSFATLLAPHVKVNSISPALLKFNESDDKAYREKTLAKALLPVEAGFDEVIQAIDFILKSNFMTGRNIQLDGGRHLTG